MKSILLLLALLLPFTAKAPTNEPPKMTVAFGFCAGVILGTATGILIIIGVRCWQRPPPLVQDTNAPAWTPMPPIDTTNAPATTNSGPVVVIDAGDAAEFCDLSDLKLTGFPEGFHFVLETSEGAGWNDLYTVVGWTGSDGQVVVVADTSGKILTSSFSPTRTNRLEVPVMEGQARLYRVRSL